ncbi:MAG: AAA family ATPase, partial [Veillonella caviae]|nr:AAA family ATPase [Veillonella caviae]
MFKTLFNANQKIQNESETLELMIGSGQLFDKSKKVSHPLLLRKVTIQLNPTENSIEVYDVGAETELYSALLSGESFINQLAIQDIQEEVDEFNYHPFDLEETRKFFKNIIHKLSPTGNFLEKNEVLSGNSTDTLFIKMRSVLFIRRKLDGLPEFIDKMVSYTQHIEKLPLSIRVLVGEDGAPEKNIKLVEKTFEEELAETSGEDTEILLSKPANKEQLEIARQIELHDSVIVQGPPGTGKTHTIANLIGHFLSKGQRVLVTSYTSKALKVLKEKLPEKLQSLCVAVIADDKKETEKAIDGISEEINNSNSRVVFEKVTKLKKERLQVINELTNIRKNIYAIKYNEFNTIAYEGESISLSQMGRFINENKEKLNYIPGEVSLKSSFPLSNSELVTLYSSNVDITTEEEKSLNISIIDPSDLVEPNQFRVLIEKEKGQKEEIQRLKSSLNAEVKRQGEMLRIDFGDGVIRFDLVGTINLELLNSIISDIHPLSETWMQTVALDGILGGSASEKWQILINQVEAAKQIVNEVTSLIFGKKIEIRTDDLKSIIDIITKMKSAYESNGSIGFWTKLVNRDFSKVEKLVFIDGHKVSSLEDCDVILAYTRLVQVRLTCANCWDSLLVKYGVPSFAELNVDNNFEQIATTYITSIKRCLSWHIDDISKLEQELLKNNIDCQCLLQLNESQYTTESVDKINKFARDIIPQVIELINAC